MCDSVQVEEVHPAFIAYPRECRSLFRSFVMFSVHVAEVGHNALGAGQIIDQGAKLVDKAVQSGDIFEGEGWRYMSENLPDGTLHFIGLLSDGGVHSRYDQLLALIQGTAGT